MKLKSCMVWMSILALLSCNSSEQEPETFQEEVFPLKFSLSLKEEILSFPETRGIPPLNIAEPIAVTRGDDIPKSLKEQCCIIEYIVFKDGGDVPYRNMTFTREDIDFGVISDQLPRGEYEFIMVAHNSSSVEISDNHLVFDRLTDTFYNTFYLDIEPGNNHEESITLYRVVSKVEFVSTDIVPENAKEFTIQLDKYPCLLDMFTGHGVIPEEDPILFSYSLSDHIGNTDITHAFFTFVPEEGASLIANLKAINTEDGILRERIVEDIQPVANKIIRYKGRLYNSSHSDDEFTITLDEDGEWSETIEKDLGD